MFHRTLLEKFQSRSGSRLKLWSGSTGSCMKFFWQTLH